MDNKSVTELYGRHFWREILLNCRLLMWYRSSGHADIPEPLTSVVVEELSSPSVPAVYCWDYFTFRRLTIKSRM